MSLFTGLPLMDCMSIAKASKVRILHLPPRASCRPAVIGSHRPSMAVREEYVRTRSVSSARPAATTFAHRRAKLRQRAALRQPWSVPTQPRCVSDSNWQCACLRDLGHQRPRAFGSKFRAITRAITHGQLGVITVSRGRSRERTPVPQPRSTRQYFTGGSRLSRGQRTQFCSGRDGQPVWPSQWSLLLRRLSRGPDRHPGDVGDLARLHERVLLALSGSIMK